MHMTKYLQRTLWVQCLLVVSLHAQEYYFSQLYNTPLYFNAAHTGRITDDYRVGLIHRRQWASINVPFITGSFFGDMNFYKSPLGADKIGGGLLVANDQKSDIINTTDIMLSGAWHKALDVSRRHRFSFGLQLGGRYTTFDASKLVFANQVDPTTNTPNSALNSGEHLGGNTFAPNAHVGLLYDFLLTDKLDLGLGLSIQNLLRPNEDFITSGNNSKAPMKIHGNIGLTYKINPKLGITPTVYMLQYLPGRDIVMAGLNAYYHLNGGKRKNPLTLHAGLWNRVGTDFILYGGLRYFNFQLGVSYDRNITSLQQNIPGRPGLDSQGSVGASEITLLIHGFLNRAIPAERTIPCLPF